MATIDQRGQLRAPVQPAALSSYIDEQALEIRVARLSYASPLEVSLVVGQIVLGSVSALSALIYAVKRLYGLDLELKTHREERRAEFTAAQHLASLVQREAGSDDSGWPPGVRHLIDNESRSFRTHRATGVALNDEELDPNA